MLLTFTKESIEKIRKGFKYSTMRRNPHRWAKWYFNLDARREDGYPLHIYEGNPRNKGRFIAKTHCTNLYTVKGNGFCLQEAHLDGFGSVESLKARLATLHHMTIEEVEAILWAFIEFDINPILEAQ